MKTLIFEPLFTTQHKLPCVSAAFSPDGSFFATSSLDASIKMVQMSKLKENLKNPASTETPLLKTIFDHSGPVNEITFHPNGHVLASASDDGSIKFFDLHKTYAKRSFRFLQVCLFIGYRK